MTSSTFYEVGKVMCRRWSVDITYDHFAADSLPSGEMATQVAQLCEAFRTHAAALPPMAGGVFLMIGVSLPERPPDPVRLFRRTDMLVIAALERLGYLRREQLEGYQVSSIIRPGLPQLRISLLTEELGKIGGDVA